jgi:hypothetical protein
VKNPFGKLSKHPRPKGPMGSAQFGRGWTRSHNFDQNPGLPKRKTRLARGVKGQFKDSPRPSDLWT